MSAEMVQWLSDKRGSTGSKDVTFELLAEVYKRAAACRRRRNVADDLKEAGYAVPVQTWTLERAFAKLAKRRKNARPAEKMEVDAIVVAPRTANAASSDAGAGEAAAGGGGAAGGRQDAEANMSMRPTKPRTGLRRDEAAPSAGHLDVLAAAAGSMRRGEGGGGSGHDEAAHMADATDGVYPPVPPAEQLQVVIERLEADVAVEKARFAEAAARAAAEKLDLARALKDALKLLDLAKRREIYNKRALKKARAGMGTAGTSKPGDKQVPAATGAGAPQAGPPKATDADADDDSGAGGDDGDDVMDIGPDDAGAASGPPAARQRPAVIALAAITQPPHPEPGGFEL